MIVIISSNTKNSKRNKNFEKSEVIYSVQYFVCISSYVPMLPTQGAAATGFPVGAGGRKAAPVSVAASMVSLWMIIK